MDAALASRETIERRLGVHTTNFRSVFGRDGFVYVGGVAMFLRCEENSTDGRLLRGRIIRDIDILVPGQITQPQYRALEGLGYYPELRDFNRTRMRYPTDSYHGPPQGSVTDPTERPILCDIFWAGLKVNEGEITKGARGAKLRASPPLNRTLVIDPATFVVMKFLTYECRLASKDCEDVKQLLSTYYEGKPSIFLEKEAKRLDELLGPKEAVKFGKRFRSKFQDIEPLLPWYRKLLASSKATPPSQALI